MQGTTYSRASSGGVCWIYIQSRREMYGCDSRNYRRWIKRKSAHNMFGVGLVFAASVNAIHAKIANCRKHFLHELSTRLVRENRRICVGSVNSRGLARTSLAKSVLDAGWSQLRSQLHYKAIRHGAEYLEVDERLTTQVCSGRCASAAIRAPARRST